MMAESQLTKGGSIVAGLVKRLGASAMARRLECGESLVRAHALGERVPRAPLRERYREIYDVPPEAWLAPASSGRAPAPPSVSPRTQHRGRANGCGHTGAVTAAPETDHAKAAVVDLLLVARAQLEAAQGDDDTSYREKAGLINSATGLCRLLARLSGQLEVTEAQILRSAPWARLVALVKGVLEKHPEAAKTLDKALFEYEAG